MNDFHKSPGRPVEITVGCIAMLIALLFVLGLVLLLFKMRFEFTHFAVAATLVACVYWFAQLGYRLVFNKHRKDGGLLSVGELRFWCQFFGVVSVIECAVGIYQGKLVLVLAGALMAIACLFGLRIADARAARKNQS